MSNKCISYLVDPDLLQRALQSGTPVDNLPVKDVRPIKAQPVSVPENFQNSAQSLSAGVRRSELCKRRHLYQNPPDAIKIPRPINSEYPRIEISALMYKQVLAGGLIKISEKSRNKSGRIFRVINKETGSYVVRRLQVINEHGYFARVF